MEDLPGADARKLCAHRRALETTCVTCGRNFRFGEEIACCSTCGRYQHMGCWEGNTCPHPSPDAGETPIPARSTPAAAGETRPARSAPAAAAPPLLAPAGNASLQLAISPLRPPTPLLTAELSVAPVAEVLAPVRLNPDERACPNCGETIKSAALRCRFCNTVLNERMKAADIPEAERKLVASNARNALIFGLLGLVILAPVLASMAISAGNSAIAGLDRFPLYDGPRGKARAGIVLGWIGWVLFVIGVFGWLSRT